MSDVGHNPLCSVDEPLGVVLRNVLGSVYESVPEAHGPTLYVSHPSAAVSLSPVRAVHNF